jgi:hypothetical protein
MSGCTHHHHEGGANGDRRRLRRSFARHRQTDGEDENEGADELDG